MTVAGRTMSRRYRYEPRMTARQLSEEMTRHDLTAGQLARITGTNIDRVHKWLKGEEDITVFVQRDFYVWARMPAALEMALDWADEHAFDVRADDRRDTPSRGDR